MQTIEKLTYLIEGLGSMRSNSNGFALDIMSGKLGYSAKLYPECAMMDFALSKKVLPLSGLLNATGFTLRDAIVILGNRVEDRRTLNYSNEALVQMFNHLDREDLLPHQRAVSELICKLMQGAALNELLAQLDMIMGNKNNWKEGWADAFPEEMFRITADELNEAMRLYYLYTLVLHPLEHQIC